ncbi:FMN-binding negative transcriptional regulator [Occallatibacter savannae]|uniref:FMN-binding negative transcriptional regulator n=1 Tax=Occallatibacter savannae TaxID=1002691 RepID=UPI00194F5B10|nr:FMN-binding negative transcriptional regulator [Occallatibacter savannae]
MYIPKFNLVADRAILLETMRAYSFAILFGPLDPTIGRAPHRATHLPLVVRDEGPHGVLEGHFAKANPHWQALANRPTLVVFPGPHSYVSPSLYVEQTSVPTWNYIAIHAYGTLELVEEETAKEALLFNLIDANEPAYADKWRGMPEDYRRGLLKGIVGFRIPIAHIEGKFKLSQNRSEADRRGVEAAHRAGGDDQRALADWMKRLIG